jgi:hypothetical protein
MLLYRNILYKIIKIIICFYFFLSLLSKTDKKLTNTIPIFILIFLKHFYSKCLIIRYIFRNFSIISIISYELNDNPHLLNNIFYLKTFQNIKY